MVTYRQRNWQELFETFDKSDLTQTEFCKQYEINPKHFSQKLAKNIAGNTTFAKVSGEPKKPITTGVIPEVGHCKAHCLMEMPIPSFVTLVESLA